MPCPDPDLFGTLISYKLQARSSKYGIYQWVGDLRVNRRNGQGICKPETDFLHGRGSQPKLRTFDWSLVFVMLLEVMEIR